MRFIVKLIRPLIIPLAALVLLLLLYAGGYIVLPEGVEFGTSALKGWSAVATGIGKSASGNVRIDLAISNETGDWSAMQAIPGKAAVLTAKDGKSTDCPVVFVGTGGHRLAPGVQMRGFTGGNKAEPATQMIYVECQTAHISPGSKLSINNYSYVTGKYNYYEKDANRREAKLEVDLDKVAADVTYPIAAPVEGLILKPNGEITALNDVVLSLAAVARTGQGVQFKWRTVNPGKYPTYVHIGTPPVIGADGILYGYYQSPDIASLPITPAGKSAV
jgi:hypothetical protein